MICWEMLQLGAAKCCRFSQRAKQHTITTTCSRHYSVSFLLMCLLLPPLLPLLPQPAAVPAALLCGH